MPSNLKKWVILECDLAGVHLEVGDRISVKQLPDGRIRLRPEGAKAWTQEVFESEKRKNGKKEPEHRVRIRAQDSQQHPQPTNHDVEVILYLEDDDWHMVIRSSAKTSHGVKGGKHIHPQKAHHAGGAHLNQ